MINTNLSTGWIEVICGSMFCGKTEELMRRLRRAEIARLRTAIFKPQIDVRYSEKHIVSHSQLRMESHIIEKAHAILPFCERAQVIGIDEAQFFDDGLVDVCKTLALRGKRVIVAGLDKDFRTVPYGPMPRIMCEADYLDKLQAICMVCGSPANFTQRLTKDSAQVVVGEADIYEARCRNCYEPPEE